MLHVLYSVAGGPHYLHNPNFLPKHKEDRVKMSDQGSAESSLQAAGLWLTVTGTRKNTWSCLRMTVSGKSPNVASHYTPVSLSFRHLALKLLQGCCLFSLTNCVIKLCAFWTSEVALHRDDSAVKTRLRQN